MSSECSEKQEEYNSMCMCNKVRRKIKKLRRIPSFRTYIGLVSIDRSITIVNTNIHHLSQSFRASSMTLLEFKL